jgi:predicted RNA binding protein YcfA (HicA-like mRNA interferase family)
MKVREVIRIIEAMDGILSPHAGVIGNIHPNKSSRVTIAGKPSEDLAPGTLNSIFKQAGLRERR